MRTSAFFTSFTLAVLIVLSSGCRKPDGNLGLDLQPEEELLTLRTDTLPFNLAMVPVDSLRTDERSRLLLGATQNSFSGLSEAWFSCELRLSQTSIDFGEAPICDSVVFVLKHNGPSYGLVYDQKLRVEQLTDTLSIDSSYYAVDVIPTDGDDLADPLRQPVQMNPLRSVYVGNDTLSPQVRIMLKPDFGQRILDADTAVFSSNDAWRKWFKGISVRSEYPGGGIVSLEPNAGVSYMRIHYHNLSDTTTYDLVLNSNASRVTHFRHVWPSPFEALNDSNAVEGTEQAVLLGAGGSYLRLDLSGLDSLDTPEGAVINRAEVILPVDLSPSKLARPNFLTAFLRREAGGIELSPEATSPGVAYDGGYDEERGAYVLNLPVYAQRRLNGEEVRPFVYLYSELSSVALEQVVFDTPLSTNPAQFIVAWSQ